MAALTWLAPLAGAIGSLMVLGVALLIGPIAEKPEVHVSLSPKAATILGVTLGSALVLAAALHALLLTPQGPHPAAAGQPASGAEAADDAREGEAQGEKAGEEPKEEGEPEVLSTPQLLQTLNAWRRGSAAADDDSERRRDDEKAIQQIWQAMLGASPALLHRFSALQIESTTEHSATMPFMACGCLWSLKMGPIGTSAPEMRYFCVLPHGHRERLRFSCIFAKTPGEGYRERSVLDWPQDLAGHPWGPTLSGEELAEYRQKDGSVLVMLHAFGLGSESAAEAAG